MRDNKEESYVLVERQVEALCEGETDIVCAMANVAAAIYEALGFFWVGFYRVCPKGGTPASGNEELRLGPFQGPVACTRIGYGRGVCGTAWQKGETILVDDVEQFPGHIACSSLSRSEIVVPVKSLSTGEVLAVLDIDSKELSTFDETDRRHLERICSLVATVY